MFQKAQQSSRLILWATTYKCKLQLFWKLWFDIQSETTTNTIINSISFNTFTNTIINPISFNTFTNTAHTYVQFSHQIKKKSMSRWALAKTVYTQTKLTSLLNHIAQGYGCNAWVVIPKPWWWRWNAPLKRWYIGTILCGCQPNKILWILSLWHLQDMY
jgi:hypothetical protein